MRFSQFTLMCHRSAVLNIKASMVAFTHLWGSICIPQLHLNLSSKCIWCPPPLLLHFCSVSAGNRYHPAALQNEKDFRGQQTPFLFLNLFYSLACLALNFPLVCVCVCGCPRTPSIFLVLSKLALYSLQSFQFKSSQSSGTGPFCTAVFEGFPLERLQVQHVCCVCVCDWRFLLCYCFYCQNSFPCFSVLQCLSFLYNSSAC